jgi:hypothetical protein
LTFIRDSHNKQFRHLDVSSGSLSSINLSGSDVTGAVNVVSALGAFIACTTLLLFVLTLYMSWRVYVKNKKKFEVKG